jgi:hypothetical protein
MGLMGSKEGARFRKHVGKSCGMALYNFLELLLIISAYILQEHTKKSATS